MNKEALIEVAKSTGRFLWFGFIGVVVAALTGLLTNAEITQLMWTLPVVNMAIPVGAYIVMAAGYVVKLLDRYVHTNDNTDLKGLVPGFLQ